jgi:hypothetical protein
MSDEERPHHPLAGATGRFPDGKARPNDQGELRVALSIDRAKNLVVFDFGKEVAWLSLPPDAARALAVLLFKNAAKLDGKITEVILK